MPYTYAAVTDVADLYAEHPIREEITQQLDENIKALYVNRHAFVRKTADSPALNNDATLNDDPDLQITVATDAAGKWYVVMGLVITTTVNADFRFALATPGAAAGGRMQYAFSPQTGNGQWSTTSIQSDTEVVLTMTNTVTHGMVTARGIIDTGGSGVVKVQWAQGTSHADSTYALQGSFLCGWCVEAL